MVAESRVRRVVACHNFQGESVLWDAAAQEVVWIDIAAGEIWRHDPVGGKTSTITVGERIGAIALRESGGYVAGLASGFAFVDATTGETTPIGLVESDLPSTRLNDGRVDRVGRFVCGGMDENLPREPISGVYVLTPELNIRPVISSVALANSICFSVDGATMYFTDMPTRRIIAYDYDRAGGVPRSPRLFVDLADEPGNPDGSVIDQAGYLWNAHFGGARVVRYDPSGAIDRVITVPVSNPTCCTFGGPDFTTLYITTARADLDEVQLAAEPDAGGLYAVDVDVPGLPEVQFRG